MLRNTATSMATLAAFLSILSTALTSPIAPVEPIFALDELPPYDACLFTCNLCFTAMEDTDKLLHCSNSVCNAVVEGKCPLKEYLWLGHHCDHYDVVESMWSAPKFKRGHKAFKLH